MNLDDLMITNVSYCTWNARNDLVLTFENDGLPYRLYTHKREGIVCPFAVIHAVRNKKRCRYCEKMLYECHGLSEYQQKLFHRLIEHPSIRLEWLYINHV